MAVKGVGLTSIHCGGAGVGVGGVGEQCGAMAGSSSLGGDALRDLNWFLMSLPENESTGASSNSPFVHQVLELSNFAFKISFYPTLQRALELLWLPPLHTATSHLPSSENTPTSLQFFSQTLDCLDSLFHHPPHRMGSRISFLAHGYLLDLSHHPSCFFW